MRIALHATGHVGHRTARVLLAERDLEALGFVGAPPARAEDPRVLPVGQLSEWEVLVSDDLADPERQVAAAGNAGVPVVLAAHNPSLAETAAGASVPVLVGANPQSGIACALAAMQIAALDEVTSLLIGWTERGNVRSRGEVFPFPEPIGPRRGVRRPSLWPESPPGTRFVAAPHPEAEWQGLLVQAEGRLSGNPVTRTLGVVDRASFLAPIALAAGAVMVASGTYSAGLHRPPAAPTVYLAAAVNAGLAVAALTG